MLTLEDFKDLLSAFPTMRELEIVCLPFPRLGGLEHATLASSGALGNLRSLSLTNASSTHRRQEYQTLAVLLSLCPLLRDLALLNMPIDAPETLTMERPAFQLQSLTIKLSSSRRIDMDTLAWILASTAQAGSCRRLTVHLGIRMSEKHDFVDPVTDTLGFSDLGNHLSILAPSLTDLSVMGLRRGQLAQILSRSTSALQTLEVFGTFGVSADLLEDLPSSLRSLQMRVIPVQYGGQSSEEEEHPELPVSSASFLAELSIGGKLEHLNELAIPENARFMRRGRWFNNTVSKVCRKRGVVVQEIAST